MNCTKRWLAEDAPCQTATIAQGKILDRDMPPVGSGLLHAGDRNMGTRCRYLRPEQFRPGFPSTTVLILGASSISTRSSPGESGAGASQTRPAPFCFALIRPACKAPGGTPGRTRLNTCALGPGRMGAKVATNTVSTRGRSRDRRRPWRFAGSSFSTSKRSGSSGAPCNWCVRRGKRSCR